MLIGNTNKSSLTFPAGRHTGDDSIADEVEKLLSRTADGLLVEDRRDALVLLSELLQSNEQVSPQHPLGATE